MCARRRARARAGGGLFRGGVKRRDVAYLGVGNYGVVTSCDAGPRAPVGSGSPPHEARPRARCGRPPRSPWASRRDDRRGGARCRPCRGGRWTGESRCARSRCVPRQTDGGWGVETVDAGRLGGPHRAGVGGSLPGGSLFFPSKRYHCRAGWARPEHRWPPRRGRAKDCRQALPRGGRSRVATHPDVAKTGHGAAYSTGSAPQAFCWTGCACHSRLPSAPPSLSARSSEVPFTPVMQSGVGIGMFGCLTGVGRPHTPEKPGAPRPPLQLSQPLPLLPPHSQAPPPKKQVCASSE